MSVNYILLQYRQQCCKYSLTIRIPFQMPFVNQYYVVHIIFTINSLCFALAKVSVNMILILNGRAQTESSVSVSSTRRCGISNYCWLCNASATGFLRVASTTSRYHRLNAINFVYLTYTYRYYRRVIAFICGKRQQC